MQCILLHLTYCAKQGKNKLNLKDMHWNILCKINYNYYTCVKWSTGSKTSTSWIYWRHRQMAYSELVIWWTYHTPKSPKSEIIAVNLSHKFSNRNLANLLPETFTLWNFRCLEFLLPNSWSYCFILKWSARKIDMSLMHVMSTIDYSTQADLNLLM